MRKFFITFAICCFATSLFAQKISVTSGSVNFIKNQKIIQIAYTYENMTVGKMSEPEYVEKKVSEYNQKEAGRGDRWKKSWESD